LRHLDLFSGIGGFALAAQWAGINTVAFCEIEPYAQKILKKNFPDVPIYSNIYELKRRDIDGTIDIITGGFPCQPFSVAGRKKGTKDNRDLWPQMFRVIQEFKPTWVIGENVANFVNMAFQRTKTNLESEGYEVQPFIIPACAVNAPHRRDRVWIVGYAKHNGSFTTEKQRGIDKTSNNDTERKKEAFQLKGTGRRGNYEVMANTRCHAKGCTQEPKRTSVHSSRFDWWSAEPNVGRVANGVSNRVDRLKGLGNAIVPQVAYEILKGIIKMHRYPSGQRNR
jgi:DNA (cytosine-5)-methyltransferase 1